MVDVALTVLYPPPETKLGKSVKAPPFPLHDATLTPPIFIKSEALQLVPALIFPPLSIIIEELAASSKSKFPLEKSILALFLTIN